MSLRERLATPDGKRRYVRNVFATIADRYDLITKVLSYGQDRRWKERLVNLAAPSSDMLALDLATGTGDIAFLLHTHAVQTIGLDVTLRMVELANAKRAAAPPVPGPSSRNTNGGASTTAGATLTTALDESYRVLRQGGQLLSLDFNRPSSAMLRAVYLLYLSVVGGMLGWILHRDPDTYRYIPASIRIYPGAEAVANLMRARGFTTVRHYPVLGGLMAIHHARK